MVGIGIGGFFNLDEEDVIENGMDKEIGIDNEMGL